MSMPTRPKNQTYIPAIDGLRTLAVMLVVIFHARQSWLAGGFTGVDIFFVISGFLITRNIFKDLSRNQFSFHQFYLRRVARLFPSLFITVGLTLIAAYWILNPQDLARLGHVSILTVLFSSNIFFWLEAGYFDIAAEFKPLLHTWSLAVEEQFYFVWPLLLLLFYKISRKRAVVAGLTTVGLLSFAAAIWVSQTNPTAVFFLTPFRGYQFAIGGLIGIIGVGRSTIWSSVLGIVSVLAVMVIALHVDGQSAHFYAATLPALAAGGIIWASQSNSMRWVLATPPMLWIGRRSYSIYLVHWPIIVLWKLKTDFSFSAPEAILAIIISILAGAVLHAFVEKPFRFRPGLSLRFRSSVIAGCTALGVMVIVGGAHLWGLDGLPGRVPQQFVKIASGTAEQWKLRQKKLRTGKCNLLTMRNLTNKDSAADYDIKACATPPPGKPAFLIVGDSFASDAYLVMKNAFPDVYFGQATIPGCLLQKPKRINGKLFPTCKAIYTLALNKLARQQGFDGIVLSSNWQHGHYYRIDELLKMLPEKNFKVILVGQHLRFQERLPTIVLSSMSEVEATKKAQASLKPEPAKINAIIKERFSPRAAFVNFIKLECPSQQCTVFTPDHGLMYLDDSHISIAGAKVLARRMAKTYPDLFGPAH